MMDGEQARQLNRVAENWIWVAADAIAQTAVVAIEAAGVPCALVGEQGAWVGILGEQQVVRAIAQGIHLPTASVDQVMAPPDHWFPADQRGDRSALQAMFRRHRLNYLPLVAADGTVVDVVRAVDVMEPSVTVPTKPSIAPAAGALDDLQIVRQAVNNSPNAIFSVAPDATILAWNPACTVLFGYSDAEIAGQPFALLVDDGNEHQAALSSMIQRVFDGETLNQQTLRYRTAAGQVRHTLSRLYPLFGQDGMVIACLIANTDVTALRQSETRLRKREQSLLRAQQLAQIGDWQLEVGTGEITLSATTAAMLGVKDYASVFGCEQIFERIHGSDRPLLRAIVAQAIREKTAFNLEVRSPQPDGSCQYIFLNGQVVLDEQGSVQSLFGTAQDITQRREAENVHRIQARRNQLIVQITQRIRQSLDLQEILTTAVTEIRQLLHLDRVVIYQFEADWSGVFLVEATSQDRFSILGQVVDDPCFRKSQIEPYTNGRISTIQDVKTANILPCHRELLERFDVRANLVVPILDSDHLWGLLIAHHCTEPRYWHQWEQELLQQIGTHLGLAIQQAELYEWVQNLNLELEQKVQQRTARLERANSFESLLKRITDRVRDSLDEQQILQKVVQELALELQVGSCDTGVYDLEEQTSTIQQEYVLEEQARSQANSVDMQLFPEVYDRLLQGETLHFCWRLSDFGQGIPAVRSIRTPHAVLVCPLIDNQGVIGDLWLYRFGETQFDEFEIRLVQQIANQCAIAIRQARLYEAAQAQVQELEHLNRLKDEFLSSVSHELRTPMANIKMATEMLEVKLTEMEVLVSANQPMVSRYFQILKVECQRELKLINDLLDLSRLDADTEPLLPSTMDLSDWLHHMAEPFAARTRTANQALILDIPQKMPPLVADFAYLSRILSELLNNACKYTPEHQTITLNAFWQGDHLQISVTNTGIEIAPHEQERVFERFYRIPTADPWKHEGTGLGLALVQKLAEQLGGTVTLESHDNRTVFTLHLFPSLMLEKVTADSASETAVT